MTTHAMVHSQVVSVNATAHGIESAKNGTAGPLPLCLVLTADGTVLTVLPVPNPECGPLPVAAAIPPIAPPPPAPEIAKPDPVPDPGGRRRHRVPRLGSRA